MTMRHRFDTSAVRSLPRPGTLAVATYLDLPELPGAACKHHDPRLWDASMLLDEWGEKEAPEERAQRHAEAKRICRTCPVRVECRAVAQRLTEQAEFQHQIPEGIWGGDLITRVATKPNQRRCGYCNEPFTPKSTIQRFCRKECRTAEESAQAARRSYTRLDLMLVAAVIGGSRPGDVLSPPERREVIARLSGERTTEEIAALLGLQPRTVTRIRTRLRRGTLPPTAINPRDHQAGKNGG